MLRSGPKFDRSERKIVSSTFCKKMRKFGCGRMSCHDPGAPLSFTTRWKAEGCSRADGLRDRAAGRPRFRARIMDTDAADNRPNAGSRPPFLWPDTVVVDCAACGGETRLFAVRGPAGLFWRGPAELDTFDVYDSPVCGGPEVAPISWTG